MKVKKNKFIVINRKHLEDLPYDERTRFTNAFSSIELMLPVKKYIVVNEDEPYAKKVWDLILKE